MGPDAERTRNGTCCHLLPLPVSINDITPFTVGLLYKTPLLRRVPLFSKRAGAQEGGRSPRAHVCICVRHRALEEVRSFVTAKLEVKRD